ncbi:hypothetical protein [Evansella halocellulosilytica]|uniref:hypothetical protein n=1 Tax=Evansella halocellulosilytica TaxID=2011013 RepID=UPI0015CD4954|nr:hypothetical protein [Evansella halocellulosilytica]
MLDSDLFLKAENEYRHSELSHDYIGANRMSYDRWFKKLKRLFMKKQSTQLQMQCCEA